MINPHQEKRSTNNTEKRNKLHVLIFKLWLVKWNKERLNEFLPLNWIKVSPHTFTTQKIPKEFAHLPKGFLGYGFKGCKIKAFNVYFMVPKFVSLTHGHV